MATHNRIVIVGKLGRDPQFRESGVRGKPVATLHVWTKHTAPAENGDSIEHTEWFRVVCWEGYAKAARDHLKKGDRVYIEGRMQTRGFDKDGQKHFVTEVIVSLMKFLDLDEQPGDLNHRKVRRDAA